MRSWSCEVAGALVTLVLGAGSARAQDVNVHYAHASGIASARLPANGVGASLTAFAGLRFPVGVRVSHARFASSEHYTTCTAADLTSSGCWLSQERHVMRMTNAVVLVRLVDGSSTQLQVGAGQATFHWTDVPSRAEYLGTIELAQRLHRRVPLWVTLSYTQLSAGQLDALAGASWYPTPNRTIALGTSWRARPSSAP